MEKITRRGFVPEDEKQFKGESLEKLKKAAKEVQYLLDQGYPVKPLTTFVGNHYMFSERQRLALARSVSPTESIRHRKDGILTKDQLTGDEHTVNIDGFNTIITLEVALSGSPVFLCGDGTIRDLAGLRGTYRIIDKTERAVRLLLEKLVDYRIRKACFYLDAPVSNSGRLSSLISDCAMDYQIEVECKVINDVDSVLEESNHVISTDAIILNNCDSWINLLPEIIKEIDGVWMIQLQDKFNGV
ncbi:MAG: DUF434 domain-containing protein [Eubacteriales bacterium]|nr:DUF434 domain-containing protein [Eubacteriales bacterium]